MKSNKKHPEEVRKVLKELHALNLIMLSAVLIGICIGMLINHLILGVAIGMIGGFIMRIIFSRYLLKKEEHDATDEQAS